MNNYRYLFVYIYVRRRRQFYLSMCCKKFVEKVATNFLKAFFTSVCFLASVELFIFTPYLRKSREMTEKISGSIEDDESPIYNAIKNQ